MRQLYQRIFRKTENRSENIFTWGTMSCRTLKHPAHSSYVASDYHTFPALKQNAGRHRFKDDSEVETAVTVWLITQDTH